MASRQQMIVDRDRESPDTRVERRPFGHRPRPQHVTGLQAEVEVQRRRVMQLHNEARPADHVTRLPGLVQPRNKGFRGVSQADLGGYFSMFFCDGRGGDISHAQLGFPRIPDHKPTDTTRRSDGH
jgi:hypothetical protein